MLHTSPRREERLVDQQQQSRWQTIGKWVLWAVGVAAVLTVAVFIGYRYGITLWDWIKLLIVPAVIAGGGLWFNVQQREREQRIANERAQDEALQGYLDGMSKLLTDKEQPLHKAQPGDNLSAVARARTLTVLGRLDSGRKRSVLQFLYESGLIYKEQTLLNGRHNIVSLQYANLSFANLSGANLSRVNLSDANLSEANLSEANLNEADLSNANLRNADLSNAYLSEADLSNAYLSGADLSGAYLSEANLSYADLIGADLSNAYLSEADPRRAYLIGADLSEADLIGADLSNAYLSEADLRGADLGGANLRYAKGWIEEQLLAAHSLEGATMPNGQKYEDWLKSKEG